jgi:hypothetical protein
VRPCTCDNVRPSAYSRDQCRPCWLYHNDPSYRALWGGPGEASGPAAPGPGSLPCIFLGPVLDKAGCACPARWVRACEVHTTTTITHCKECPDYQGP